jgi:hypothetical protein
VDYSNILQDTTHIIPAPPNTDRIQEGKVMEIQILWDNSDRQGIQNFQELK